MRLIHLTAALGIALASAGALLWRIGSQRSGEAGLAIGGDTLPLPAGPKHPVTDWMLKETQKLTLADAPAYQLTDIAGKPVTVSGRRQRPQFLLFVKLDCPCSVDAQPIFNDLARHYQGKVDFVGVIDGDLGQAKKWVSQNASAFPVVPDGKLQVIHAYKAKHSVYSALVSPEGKIVREWPGYSISMLAEINAKIAETLGEKARPFDPSYAPADKTSGCAFAQ